MSRKFKRQLIIISLSQLKTKSKSRVEKQYKTFHSIRPTVVTTEHYSKAQIENPVKIAPGTKSYYSTTKHGKKICVVSNSQIKRIKKNLFNNSLYTG